MSDQLFEVKTSFPFLLLRFTVPLPTDVPTSMAIMPYQTREQVRANHSY